MAYYRRCPICKAALDPGEICTDCQDKKEPAVAATTTSSKVEQESDQLLRSASEYKPN